MPSPGPPLPSDTLVDEEISAVYDFLKIAVKTGGVVYIIVFSFSYSDMWN